MQFLPSPEFIGLSVAYGRRCRLCRRPREPCSAVHVTTQVPLDKLAASDLDSAFITIHVAAAETRMDEDDGLIRAVSCR